MSQPERIVILRSGRHLQVALDVINRMYPGSHVTVIATPGTDAARAHAGIAESDWLIFSSGPRFDAWPMLQSGLPARLWSRGFDRVIVLWQDPTGSDRANVDRAASVLSPSGFCAITPDGTLIERRTAAFVWRELVTSAASLATALVLNAALYVPAAVLAAVRPRRAGAR